MPRRAPRCGTSKPEYLESVADDLYGGGPSVCRYRCRRKYSFLSGCRISEIPVLRQPPVTARIVKQRRAFGDAGLTIRR